MQQFRLLFERAEVGECDLFDVHCSFVVAVVVVVVVVAVVVIVVVVVVLS
jgi:hypothetical protein